MMLIDDIVPNFAILFIFKNVFAKESYGVKLCSFWLLIVRYPMVLLQMSLEESIGYVAFDELIEMINYCQFVTCHSFDSKRFCRDCRRNIIHNFKELKELKRMRREPHYSSVFCVADATFQYEVSDFDKLTLGLECMVVMEFGMWDLGVEGNFVGYRRYDEMYDSIFASIHYQDFEVIGMIQVVTLGFTYLEPWVICMEEFVELDENLPYFMNQVYGDIKSNSYGGGYGDDEGNRSNMARIANFN
ncbi:hypothetical protein BC332_19312 [Capsicum chinense]|nr:hypothetical protein BC332_19312 [Capsicum chinense]